MKSLPPCNAGRARLHNVSGYGYDAALSQPAVALYLMIEMWKP